MSYTVESVNGCTKKLMFNFDQLDLSGEIKTALLEKQKSSSLKGFRKGKAPLNLIEKLYRPQVENSALGQFIQGQFFAAIEKEDLQVVGHPMFGHTDYKPGESVSFEVTVETFPQVEVKDYSKLSFTQEKSDVTEDDLEALKLNYLNSKAELTPVEDKNAALKEGQTAVINFEGEKEDGERPENMKGSEFLLEIGSNQFIPGFEEGLVGQKVGEKRDVNVVFPAEYHEPSLQNAPVKFEVELLEIKEKKVPEFDDEFAKTVGFESVSDFETKNKETLSQRRKKEAEEKLNQQIIEKLIEENSFDVPNALLVNQEKHVRDELRGNLSQQGFTPEMVEEYFEKWSGDILKRAEFQVRSGLILDKIAKENKLEVSEEDFSQKISEMAEQAGLEKEKIESFYSSNKTVKHNMMYALREEKTFDLIKTKVQVK